MMRCPRLFTIRSRHPALLCFATVSLLAASCSSVRQHESIAQSATVAAAGRSVHLGVVSLTFPKGAVRTPTSVRSSPVPPSELAIFRHSISLVGGAHVLPLAKPLVSPVHIKLSSPLHKPIKLSFDLGARLTTPMSLVTFDKRHQGWVTVPATYDPRSGLLSATVTHLSSWAVVGWAIGGLVALSRQAASLALSGTGSPSPPQCPGGPSGVSIGQVGSGHPLYYCAAATSTASTTFKLVNTRNYPVDLHLPLGSQVAMVNPGPLFQRIGGTLNSLAAKLSGANNEIVTLFPPYGTATVTLPLAAGSKVSFTSQVDVSAYLFGLLGTGLQTFALTDSWLGGTSASTEAGTLAAALGTGGCLNDVEAIIHPGSSLDGTVASEVGRALFSCFAMLAEAAVAVPIGIVGLVKAVIVAITSGMSAIVDSVQGKAGYTYVANRAAPPAPPPTTTTTTRPFSAVFAPFVGTWDHHVSELIMRANGLATGYYGIYSNCTNPDNCSNTCSPATCTGKETYRFTSVQGNTAVGVVVSSDMAQFYGPSFNNQPGNQPGSRIYASLLPDDTLWLAPQPLSSLVAAQANPYANDFCGPQSPPGYCGA